LFASQLEVKSIEKILDLYLDVLYLSEISYIKIISIFLNFPATAYYKMRYKLNDYKFLAEIIQINPNLKD
jgi:hypothetical protein